MRSLNKLSLVAAAIMASTVVTNAADIIPEPQDDYIPEVMPHAVAGGWYIRGDIGYAHASVDGVEYLQAGLLTGEFEQFDLDSSWTIQGGLGYQVTDYFRVDATLRYFGSMDFTGSSAPAGSNCNGGYGFFCDYSESTELESMTMLMANAYVDLGTFQGFTPYVGAGIGGAHVSWGDLLNDQTCTGSADDPTCSGIDFIHEGQQEWRFAWALHAGASYDITCRTKLDAGYTFTRVEGGNMFGSATPVGGTGEFGGRGYDGGIDVHTGQIGLRFALDDSGCAPPPSAPIVYK